VATVIAAGPDANTIRDTEIGNEAKSEQVDCPCACEWRDPSGAESPLLFEWRVVGAQWQERLRLRAELDLRKIEAGLPHRSGLDLELGPCLIELVE
jgi:hypothetical protein